MDLNYWTNFYEKNNHISKPTNFANEIIKYFKKNKKLDLIELGCGNGRDSIFFSSLDLNVTAVDQVESEINRLNKEHINSNNLKFICGDFTKMKRNKTYDVVYTRFTLHSITEQEEKNVVLWSYDKLNKDGLFCIEVRGKKNSLFGKGNPVQGHKNAFIYENHYRRFFDFHPFCDNLKKLGFKLLFSKEEKGFAKFNGFDDYFIRIIAIKK